MTDLGCVDLYLTMTILLLSVGSVPSDYSTKTSPGASPAHLPRNRPKSMIPKIQMHLPPKPAAAQQHQRAIITNKHRLSLGHRPVSAKEIRSSSVGYAPVKEDQVSFYTTISFYHCIKSINLSFNLLRFRFH